MKLKIPKKLILDACCGGRMFWFNKFHPNTIYIDHRVAQKGHIKYWQAKNHSVDPDIVMDFRSIKFKNESFKLVVFDPPHMIRRTESGYQQAKYGSLHTDTWKQDLKTGFDECWRVLKKHGILIFKWNEVSVPVGKIISILKKEPLFGHKAGKTQKTHWLCFMKLKNV